MTATTNLLQLRMASLADSIEGEEWEQAVEQCSSLLRKLQEQAKRPSCDHRWMLKGSAGVSTLYHCPKCGQETLT